VCGEWYECDSEGICQPCGTYAPCEGNRCKEDYYYDDTDERCHSYGYVNNRCWEGNICDGWFECMDGLCVNPFRVDPTRSTSICEGIESGTAHSSREWCYWYAAYLKNDLSICDDIGWLEMEIKCRDGENPDNYYAISF